MNRMVEWAAGYKLLSPNLAESVIGNLEGTETEPSVRWPTFEEDSSQVQVPPEPGYALFHALC
jgi:hypothetical protein